MVSNEGKITTFGTSPTTGLVDGTDKMHSGLIKALWQTATGSRVVSSGTLTQSGARFTLATPVIYRTEGSKVTLAGNNFVDIDDGGDNDRYDLIYIDAGSDALAVEKGNDTLTTPQVKDINKDDVPVAIVKVTSGSTAASTTYEFQVLMSTFDKDELNDDEVTYAKIQNVSATNRILGRDSSGAGVIEEITPANLRTMINVADGADVTDATSVNAAGAIMHSDIPDSDTGFVKRTGSETYDIDTSTYLTAESDTLDTVTGRGATTANSISVGTITSTEVQNISLELVSGTLSSPAVPAITGTKSVIYTHTLTGNTAVLPVTPSGTKLYVKNIDPTNPITLTAGGLAIDSADITHPKITSPNVITLAPQEHVTLHSVVDTGGVIQAGYMIISD